MRARILAFAIAAALAVPVCARQAPVASAATAQFYVTGYVDRGYTASGTYTHPGTCAVDPRVIPLGSYFYIQGIGTCHAEDTGGAIIGYRVDVFTRRDAPDQPHVVELADGVRVIHVAAGPPAPMPKDDLWPHMPEFRDGVLRWVRDSGTGYRLIHANFWMSGWAALALRDRLGIPVVQIFHAMGVTKRRHQGERDTSPAERIAVERRIVGGVDRLIAQCPTELDELVAEYGADRGRVAVIPSGVDAERFRPVPRGEARARIGLRGDGPVVVYVGRLLPRKDVRNAVRALHILVERAERADSDPPTLLVVGGATAEPDPDATPEIGALQRLADELGVSGRVAFTGKRQHADLRFYYCAGDVVVTTPWYEPFGLTPLEAMACGRPVVGSSVGGLTYTVVVGETGFLIPPRDPQALADRLEVLLTQPELRRRMGAAGRERVERRFTWPVAARATAALYRELEKAALAPSRARTDWRVPRAGRPPTTERLLAGARSDRHAAG